VPNPTIPPTNSVKALKATVLKATKKQLKNKNNKTINKVTNNKKTTYMINCLLKFTVGRVRKIAIICHACNRLL